MPHINKEIMYSMTNHIRGQNIKLQLLHSSFRVIPFNNTGAFHRAFLPEKHS